MKIWDMLFHTNHRDGSPRMDWRHDEQYETKSESLISIARVAPVPLEYMRAHADVAANCAA